MEILRLLAIGLTLSALLLPVHGLVFWVQRRRGRPTGEALRFALTGAGFVVCFVLAVTAVNHLIDPDRSLRAEQVCEELGGSFLAATDTQDEICIVGAG